MSHHPLRISCEIVMIFFALALPTNHPALAQAPCMNVNDCTGSSYSVNKDFTTADPVDAPSNGAGPTSGGTCSASETYRTYIAWFNESGGTAVSPPSLDFQPTSGSSNFITVTRPSIPIGAHVTAWAAYYSKQSESHTKIRHCSSTNPLMPVAPASATTVDCKCLIFGGLQQSANNTGSLHTIELRDEGTLRMAGRANTVQGLLSPGSRVLEFSKDVVPHISHDAGTTFRTVDWTSPTVLHVDPIGATSSPATTGISVYSSLSLALSQVNDSGPSKPYVIKLHTNGTSSLYGTVINKPYLWIQGDGATRIGTLTVCADGVRISGMVSTGISVGDFWNCSGLVDDPTDVYIENNVIYDESDNDCSVFWGLGRNGTGRLNTITFTNNELGRSPGGVPENSSIRVTLLNGGLGRTHVYLSNNTWTTAHPIHGWEHIALFEEGANTSFVPNVHVWSIGNRFIGNIALGWQEPGEFFSCLDIESGVGALTSVNDVCSMFRSDNTSDNEEYLFFQVDQNYSGSSQRQVTLINPTLEVNLPASEVGDDTIALFNVDSPNVELKVINPTLHATLGPGFDPATDIYFGIVDGSRTPPPSSANTFIEYSSVVNVPNGSIQERNAPSYALRPLSHLVAESFDLGLVLKGADLGSTCAAGEFRYDTGGATKELCMCDPADTWNCAALSPLRD